MLAYVAGALLGAGLVTIIFSFIIENYVLEPMALTIIGVVLCIVSIIPTWIGDKKEGAATGKKV